MSIQEPPERPYWIKPPVSLLFDLVRLHTVQPWNVNLSRLLSILMKEMSAQGYIDFTASGIALLSSATILKLKSENILELQDPPKPPVEKREEFLPPPIQLPYRFEYTSTTIETLVKALEDLLKDKDFSVEPPPQPPLITEPFSMQPLDDFMTDIENRIEAMYTKILLLHDQNNLIHFSNLITDLERLDIIRTFILLLFLASRGRIYLWQNEEVDEIFISLAVEGVNGNKEETDN